MTIKAFIKAGKHIVFFPQTKSGGEHYKAFGVYVTSAELDPNIDVSSNLHLCSTIPTALENVLRYWSVRQTYNVDPTNSNIRVIGKYRLGRAVGEVSFYDNLRSQDIVITGPDLKECVQLRDLILAGSIAPWIQHRGPQVKSHEMSLKEAFHKLIETLFLALDHRKLRLVRRLM